MSVINRVYPRSFTPFRMTAGNRFDLLSGHPSLARRAVRGKVRLVRLDGWQFHWKAPCSGGGGEFKSL